MSSCPEISVTLLQKMTFASHQHAVPLIQDLAIHNHTAQHFDNLTLEFSASPAFVRAREWTLDRLQPGATLRLTDRDVSLDAQMLMQLTEAIRGEAVFVLKRGEETLATQRATIELLARHEWGGIAHMPELLAAFAMPNDPAIDHLLKNASEVLRQAGQASLIDGYSSGSRRRVWEIVSALWSAVCNLGLDYALPPASFEAQGQKIRLPAMIMASRRATCLDLALLFAAALEQAGLNPVIVITKGHALAGVWLQPDVFASVLIDDASMLRKRIDLDELMVFETTLSAHHPALGFSAALQHGARQIAVDVEADFLIAVDIRRARMLRIRPLHTDIPIDVADTHESTQAFHALEAAPALPDFDSVMTASHDDLRPETRLDRWQRRLLDLSLRNRLLNFRATRKSVKLFCPRPALLKDNLAAGRKIKIVPVPALANEAERAADIHYARTGEYLTEAYAAEALKRHEVMVELDKPELETRLIELYRTARNDLQEGGANTLFLALGFLVWQRNEKEARKFRAPLILMPVSLERRTIRSGIRMVLHEDEPRFNTTLLQMLRQDFNLDIKGFDDALPRDEHGIDVSAIWTHIRQETKEMPEFEVVEDVVLGIFSFAKYLMWKDLVDRTEQLMANKVVRHLIETPRDPYASEIDFPAPSSLDRDYTPDQLFTPLAADSSQLAAIIACAKGKDFVLIGPPGTGKSQTIANMISHNLAEGRTVLFVSEKIAALDVVYRRLRAIGLGEFCLELHSNKARKLEVLAQLRSAWNASGTRSEAAWRREAARLQTLRDQLNRFVQRLHHRHGNGLTIFHAMGQMVRHDDVPPIALSWPAADHHSEDDFNALDGLARRLDIHAEAIAPITHVGLQTVRQGDWSPGWQQRLVASATRLAGAAKTCTEQFQALLSALGLPNETATRDQTCAAGALMQLLSTCTDRDLALALDPAAKNVIAGLEQGLELLQTYRQTEAQLSCPYADQAWRRIQHRQLAERWRTAMQTWWPKSIFSKWAVRKQLAQQGGATGKPDCAHDLDIFDQLKQVGEQIEAFRTTIGEVPLWQAFETDTAATGATIQMANDLRAAVLALSAAPDTWDVSREALQHRLADAHTSMRQRCQAAYDSWLDVQEAIAAYSHLAGADVTETVLVDRETTWLAAVQTAAASVVDSAADLNSWCAWQRTRAEAVAAGLANLVDAIEHGDVTPGTVQKTFKTSYCRWWANAVIDNDEVLRRFTSSEHEDCVQQFKALDDRFADLTQQLIRSRLASRLPKPDDVTRGSEFGILRRELEKKQRHKPLRQLITEMPTALTRLTPCLLMSPLSIAQYLTADQALFDVVIFDEASQITVWDAIGAMARGRQTVVVGDPKQLPPTNFFNRSDEDAEETDEVESDLESILDECLGASLPEQRITWHYRSEHESLIAFSNHRYYGGSLVTFPSPLTQDVAVRYRHVPDGIYERSGARINKGEAQAIVAEVVRRLQDPAFAQSKKSIGIVTFNSEQQRLIEDLLDEERRQSPQLEPFFAEDGLEPVFVKNLENVQGDERDIMLFSITYGPDISGRMTMNFGPMNRDGGERRLNVAITRARSELLVFATLRPEQIDLSRTQANGVRDLKHFLEYAERGPKALAEAVYGSVGDGESPFEQAVAQRLIDKGWVVHHQIGVSSFRIDLGIVHPDAPGIYLAGIECDGATYHRAATARDRDKLREQILRRLGWTILRVWSPDWWFNAADAAAKLHQSLLDELARSREKMARQQQNGATPSDSAEDRQQASAERSADANATVPAMPLATAVAAPHGDRQATSTQSVYRVCDPAEATAAIDPAKFYDSDYNGILLDMIAYVIEAEGPIHETVLVQRLVRAHRFQRAGRRIRDRVRQLATHHFDHHEEDVGTFFWPRGISAADWHQFRPPHTSRDYREVEIICVPELLALARDLQTQGLSDAPAAMARQIGMSRLTASARKRLEDVLQTLV